jgi:hypothetical protein
MTGDLPPISSSWGQPLEAHDHNSFFNGTLTAVGLMEHFVYGENVFDSYKYAWPFVKCTYRTYTVLLKILPFALYTSPLSIQALQSSSCLSYVSYATTSA